MENAGLSQYLQNACFRVCSLISLTPLVHFFGSLFRVFVGGNIGESDILRLLPIPVTYFSLYMEANHQLVDHHTDDGTKEWGKNWHQEPPFSSTEEWEKRFIRYLFLFCRQ